MAHKTGAHNDKIDKYVQPAMKFAYPGSTNAIQSNLAFHKDGKKGNRIHNNTKGYSHGGRAGNSK
ncbi:MAG: hypothetical protein ACK4NC_06465 [Candidatus Gracilibacteria bacterium]